MIQDFDKNKEKYRKKCFEFTAERLRESVNQDNFIVQAISEINELDKVINMLSRRLNEYAGLYVPELYERINDNETYARIIATKTRKQILEDLKLDKSIGFDLKEKDKQSIIELANQITTLFQQKNKVKDYLELLLKKYVPNIYYILGTMLTAKLLAQAGSLKSLSLFPASTVQMLGAETALFRHLKTGAKCPKYGHLFLHPLVANAAPRKRGKAARMLADKVSIAAKVDYFKGDFVADKLLMQLENKLKI